MKLKDLAKRESGSERQFNSKEWAQSITNCKNNVPSLGLSFDFSPKRINYNYQYILCNQTLANKQVDNTVIIHSWITLSIKIGTIYTTYNSIKILKFQGLFTLTVKVTVLSAAFIICLCVNSTTGLDSAYY